MSVEILTVAEDEDGMRLDRWFKRRHPSLDGRRISTRSCAPARSGSTARAPRCRRGSRPASRSACRRCARTRSRRPRYAAPAPSEDDRRAIAEMVLFEDRDLLVLNKPYGLAVQGGSGTKHHIDGMLEALADADGNRPLLVHRLDRDTSGVLLVARNRQDRGGTRRGVPLAPGPQDLLGPGGGRAAARRRGASRCSWPRARPWAKAAAPASKATGPLAERMRVAKHGEENAQHSVTLYATVDRVLPRLAWLSMKPITGRTHQLRAHAEAIGHPIIGDPKYGRASQNAAHEARSVPRRAERRRAEAASAGAPAGRCRIRAAARIDVTAPLPPHMQQSWDLFGFDIKQFDPIENAPE